MSSNGDQKINVTKDREDVAKTNYTEVREVVKRISKEFGITIADVINFMTSSDGVNTGISVNSFYNYCRTGKVSRYSKDIFLEFFDNIIPENVFTAEKAISVDEKIKIYSILGEKLNASDMICNHFSINGKLLERAGFEEGYHEELPSPQQQITLTPSGKLINNLKVFTEEAVDNLLADIVTVIKLQEEIKRVQELLQNVVNIYEIKNQ